MCGIIRKIFISFIIILTCINTLFPNVFSVYGTDIQEPESKMTLDEFRIAIESWLDNKLNEMTNNSDRVDYIARFATDNQWKREVAKDIPYNDVDSNEANEIVQEIAQRKYNQYTMYTNGVISLETARIAFLNYLRTLKTEKEQELGNMDEESINIELQEYFQNLKAQFLQGGRRLL